LALTAPAALAQMNADQTSLAAPDYGSGHATGAMSNTNFNTPESDGRPGVKFYKQGMAAYRRGDVEHTIYMLKLAAYWAYAPAAYNLGVMYFQGEGGVPVDRPLGAAWMFIAAERGSSAYVNARHMMVGKLDYAERTKALELLQQLQPKYGNATALRRAKSQWAFAKSRQTGTRVGGTVGELRVGTTAAQGSIHTPSSGPGGTTPHVMHSWMQILSGGSMDGSIAYQQFRQSDNPYSPIFLKNLAGTATVGPLELVDKAQAKPQSKQAIPGQSPAPSDQDSQHDPGL
jgi:hypothetical protein